MHGVTGRMGMNQHLVRSILEIRKQGGVALKDGTRLMPDPILIGRNAAEGRGAGEEVRRRALDRPTLTEALKNEDDEIFFDAASTQLRPKLLKQAIAAGKHVYCEKPVATDARARPSTCTSAAKKARVKHGVVQDKLWLPGMLKLAKLRDEGFFGKILSVRGEFGYWVFEGDRSRQPPAQRPSWNYRKQDGGGIILDMLCHWRYVLDNLFGEVQAVSCLGATHIPFRWDENGKKYKATADDAAYATFKLAGGAIAHFNSSWTVRVRRDDLLTLQVDGTKGSAVAGLRALPRSVVRKYAQAGVEPGHSAADRFLRRLGGSARRELRQRLQGAVGAVPAARRRRGQVPLGTCSKARRACSSPSSA